MKNSSKAAMTAGIVVLAGMMEISGHAAQAQTPLGNATGLQVQVLSLVGVNFAQTDNLTASGTEQTAGVASVDLGVLNTRVSTGVITASTQGTPLNGVTNVSSTALVNGLSLFPSLTPFGSTLLTADTVGSTTTFSSAPFSSAGSTTIENLVFGGSSVVVTGAANQMVSIDGIATLVINEQIFDGNVRTTNALHLTVLSGINAGEVVVSQSVAGFAGGSAVGAPEPGTGTLALAFGPLVPAFVARARRRRLRQAA